MRVTHHDRSSAGRGTTRPEILDPASPEDRARLAELRSAGPRSVTVHDEIGRQLRELAILSAPSAAPSEELVAARIAEILRGVAPDDFGRWVYFPWSARLVHLLPSAEFHLLRHDRNRHKVT